MKEILLTQSKMALVDDDNYEWLNQWKWCANRAYGEKYYAVMYTREGRKNRKRIYMHRLIIESSCDMDCDHIDGNGLNNQRSNLRLVTHRQNMQNILGTKTSKYPGVCWHKASNRWSATISINGKAKHLGIFATEIDAFNAYCNALKSINEVLVGK